MFIVLQSLWHKFKILLSRNHWSNKTKITLRQLWLPLAKYFSRRIVHCSWKHQTKVQNVTLQQSFIVLWSLEYISNCFDGFVGYYLKLSKYTLLKSIIISSKTHTAIFLLLFWRIVLLSLTNQVFVNLATRLINWIRYALIH